MLMAAKPAVFGDQGQPVLDRGGVDQPIGRVTRVIRSFVASQASSYQVIAETAISAAPASVCVAAGLSLSGWSSHLV